MISEQTPEPHASLSSVASGRRVPPIQPSDVDVCLFRLGLSQGCLHGLWQVLESEGVDLTLLQTFIEQNRWLEERLLRVASQLPHLGKQGPDTLEEFYETLPAGDIPRLVLAAYLQQVFAGSEGDYGWSESEHWSHAVFVACVNEEIARRAGVPEAVAFAVGLTHGIGRYLVAWHLQQWGSHVGNKGAINAEQLKEEATRFGMNQCDIGALILERLGFPEQVCIPVKWFRFPQLAPGHRAACERLEQAIELVLKVRSQAPTGGSHGAELEVGQRHVLARALSQVRLIELALVSHPDVPLSGAEGFAELRD